MIKPTDFQTQSVNQNTPRVSIATQSTNVGAAPINHQQSPPTQLQCNSEMAQNTHNTVPQSPVPQNGRDVPSTTTPVSEFRPTFSTQLSVSQSTQTSVNDSVAVDIQTCIPNESLVAEATNTAEDTEEAPFYNEIIPVLHVEPIYEVPRLLTGEVETNANEVDGTDRRVTPAENGVENAATTDEVRDPHGTCSRLEIPVVPVGPDVINNVDTLSRATTPDRDELDLTMCPPSYDEVAVTTRLGPLGMPKFAYETM